MSFQYYDRRLLEGWMYTSMAMSVLAVGFMALRVYVAKFVVRRWFKDDTFILLALLFAVAFGVIQVIEADFMSDMLAGRQRPGKTLYFKLQGMAAYTFYALATLTAKFAVLFYLLRLTVSRHVAIVAYVTMAFAVAQCLLLIISSVGCTINLMSIPDLLFPNQKLDTYKACSWAPTAWIVSAFINSLTDLTLLVLPVWILWPLRARWDTKLAVLAVLMAGGFVFGVSIYRAYMLFDLIPDQQFFNGFTKAGFWCAMELSVGLLCACFPALKALWNHSRKLNSTDLRLRTLKLRTLTQPATMAYFSKARREGVGTVGLGGTDTTATAANTALYPDTTAKTTTKVTTDSGHDGVYKPLSTPGRARVATEKIGRVCGGECGESDASLCVCSGPGSLSVNTTFQDEASPVHHDAMWSREEWPTHSSSSSRRFLLVTGKKS